MERTNGTDRQERGALADAKDAALAPDRDSPAGEYLTTNQGLRINQTDDSLKAGGRGPTLLEDFHFREKMTHFDHERIPERVVHARGSGAYGVFRVYEPLAELTKAGFLQDPAKETPVFVRFSTVAGSRGSADTVRDVRGFAVKFYTEEGNFDLVGNNIPVFFIQDAIKFPDIIHAVKPEQHNEIPQASSAHDTFWDFISLQPESTHMIMWLLSDRAIPRSYRMMQGFGVHTFRFVNAAGKARFVKFHWTPVLGVHSLVWDEAQKLAGKDPDFHRRDLWEAIEMGQYPEYELGVQVVEEEDEHAFDFDLLDATKIIPEELVPVRQIGKLTLNRNPENFFAETEQVAFHTAHVVPGIDFTNDPLLQGRLFSYLDTQLIRLGGPNFADLPVNRPVAPVHNNQRDGFGRRTINRGRVAYSPNTLGGGCPMLAPEAAGGYAHYAEKVEGHKIRQRSPSFDDHFTQATLFWKSLSDPEREHLIAAAQFELGKVETPEIRERMVARLLEVDAQLAGAVALGIGVAQPTVRPAVAPSASDATAGRRRVDRSPALSMEHTAKSSVQSRRVAFLAADGFDLDALRAVRTALQNAGATVEVISRFRGKITSASGDALEVDRNAITAASVMYDAVFVPGGRRSVEALALQGDAVHFVAEAYRHHKAIGATGEGVDLLLRAAITGAAVANAEGAGNGKGDGAAGGVVVHNGVVTTRKGDDLGAFVERFVAAIAAHRHWTRSEAQIVPA